MFFFDSTSETINDRAVGISENPRGDARSKGTFNNYVNQILSNFDHLPTSSGQTRTYYTFVT